MHNKSELYWLSADAIFVINQSIIINQ